MDFTRDRRPEGRAITSSPRRSTPEATVPLNPRKSRFGRSTYWTGKRRSMRLRSVAMLTVSRWFSSVAPSYQGMCSLRSTTLSPLRAERGMKWMSPTSSFAANPR